MDGEIFDNLTSMIVQSLVGFEGMTKIDMVNKLMCFGTNGSTIFQGVKMSVNTQFNARTHSICEQCRKISQTWPIKL
jgi:hypothetical protein